MSKKSVLLFVFGLISLVVLVSALYNLTRPKTSSVVERLGDDDKARLAEIVHLRTELGAVIWPGFERADIPLILYNEEYAFLVNHAGQPAVGWIKVPNGPARGGAWQVVPDDSFQGQPYYRQQLLEPGITPEAFTVQVGDRWVASMQTREWLEISLQQQIEQDLPALLRAVFPYRLAIKLLLGGEARFVASLEHESFHAYQGIVAPERLEAAENVVRFTEANYPWENVALQQDWQTELDLLSAALRTESVEDAAGAAGQFLAQRDRRRNTQKLTVRLVDYERQREWLEGIAKYVELESWRAAAEQSNYNPATDVAGLDGMDYQDFEKYWSQEVNQIRRMADDQGDGRFYYSGMAQAVLLDRLLPDWKSRIMDEGVFLEDLLRQAVPLESGVSCN